MTAFKFNVGASLLYYHHIFQFSACPLRSDQLPFWFKVSMTALVAQQPVTLMLNLFWYAMTSASSICQ
jgi:hypothetical protein